ncbi:hypothetical protein BN130_280 [Cronobacter malonaticus 507]|nr:hypothetical protein BN130_280 [Cronobacter malonaticus 507]
MEGANLLKCSESGDLIIAPIRRDTWVICGAGAGWFPFLYP